MLKLKSLICHHIGPFDESQATFEEQLTVVTGRNDSGKSRLLRVIQMMLARNPKELASELEINLDLLSGASKPWKDDDRVSCDAVFTMRGTSGMQDINVHSKLVPSQVVNTRVHHPNQGHCGGIDAIKLLPKCLLFGSNEDDGVRQDLALDELNPTEKRFFGLAFGPEANVKSLAAMSPVAFETTIGRAETTLNKRLDQLLPQTLRYRFRLRAVADKRDRLIVNLADQHSCSTALGMRGSGVRKMINLLSRLAIENIGEEPTIVMLDEPETSLHADAQHTLRGFLEELAKLPTIQVIYATHSPCMVNCMRPETLRLMERVAHGESARSRMVSLPVGGGFAAIRSSLGTSPADSLLYAPLTMVVEGSTEELCLPLVLQKLGQSGIAGFEEVNRLLAQAMCLNAEGTPNIPNLCRIAERQGSRVVVFCDGDVAKSWQEQFKKDRADTPFHPLPTGIEFEQIIPLSAYLAAVRQVHSLVLGAGEDEFAAWWKTSGLPERMAFSKRVEQWLIQMHEQRGLKKLLVMRTALDSVEASQLDHLDVFEELVASMKRALT